MARGLQKAESQAKAQAKAKSSQGGASQLGAGKAGLKIKCAACFIDMPNVATYKQHYEAKHEKSPPLDWAKITEENKVVKVLTGTGHGASAAAAKGKK